MLENAIAFAAASAAVTDVCSIGIGGVGITGAGGNVGAGGKAAAIAGSGAAARVIDSVCGFSSGNAASNSGSSTVSSGFIAA